MALIRALGFLTVFAPSPSRTNDDLPRLAETFWWAAPFVEAVWTASLAAACILLIPYLPQFVIAILFVGIDHIAHGLRRLDGFSDLGEAMLFLRANPHKTRAEAWQIARAGANGPYGTALIALTLLLHVSLSASLLQLGRAVFAAGMIAAALFSKLGLVVAVAAPHRFTPTGDFVRFAADLTKPLRVVLLAAVVMLATAGVSVALSRPVPILLLIASLVVACCAGLASRALVLHSLGELNGDMLGMGWVSSELALLTIWLAFRGGDLP